ncbi:MAG: TM0106 family RecB-like putative nuclease [Leptolyngbyaceae cyanobacterium]
MQPSVGPATPETPATLNWLTDQSLFHYQRCHRRAYLDRYGDRGQIDPPSDYLRKIKQDSAIHRQQIMADYQPWSHPEFTKGDWLQGSQATLKLMAAGVNTISGGVLINPLRAGLYLVTQPDLLVKQPGWSFWGDWQYEPVDIKLGKKPKLDYQIIAAYHAYVLAQVQGNWPEASWLALRAGRYYAVDLSRQLPTMTETLEACLQDLHQDSAPEVFIAHSRCDLCHWYSHCYGQAKQVNHLSLLPGVTPARYTHLQTLGLTTVETLATAQPTQLAHLPGFGDAVAEKLVHQAQATCQDQAIARTHHQQFPIRPADLPSATVELYFDIEAAPDVNLIYLHGVLVVDHRRQTEVFHALLAETLDAEQQAWQQFLDLVQQYPEAPIYHFCPYEAQTVRKLSEKYDTLPADVLERLLARFVDIHYCVTEAVTLPVESYALKHIARWMGFQWRDAGANGAQSICWYNDWLETGDRAHLEAILRYNEDDCRATYHVKQWLSAFAQPHWHPEVLPAVASV